MTEWNTQTVYECFRDIRSNNPIIRRPAEIRLAGAAAGNPKYGLLLVQFIGESTIDEDLRILANDYLKSHIRTRWLISIPVDEKGIIKTRVFDLLLLSGEANIRLQVAQTIGVIGKFDFPNRWPNLLPSLISNLERVIIENAYDSIILFLYTVDLLFGKLRLPCHTADDSYGNRYCLEKFAQPLLTTFHSLSLKLDSIALSSVETVYSIIDSQRICCSIFHSMTFYGISGLLELSFQNVMNLFWEYLTFSHIEQNDEFGTLHLDKLQAAVFEVLNSLVERSDPVFSYQYVDGFVSQAIRMLRVTVISPVCREQLTMACLSFLTAASTNSIYHSLFSLPAIQNEVIKDAVMPCLMVQQFDEERFLNNYLRYIKNEKLGKTRQRLACNLLLGIADHYKESTTLILKTQFNESLMSFNDDPFNNWKNQISAFYLMTYVGDYFGLARPKSFFQKEVLIVLQDTEVNSYPMLKASALAVLISLQASIPKDVALLSLNHLVRLLNSDINAVHTYAAICIENFLTAPDYSPLDINLIGGELRRNLHLALQKPNSAENEYILSCINHVP